MRPTMFLAFFISLFSIAMTAQLVDEVITKNINARGGMARLKAVQSIRLTGDSDVGGMQAEFLQLQKRPNKLRRTITIQGLELVQAYDGQNGWQIVPFTGKKDPEPVAADDLRNLQDGADLDGPLVDYKQKGHKVELVGKEKSAGVDAYHLKLTMKSGTVSNIYLSADNFLEIMTKQKIMQRGAEIEFESTLGDYRDIDGIKVPFSMSSSQAGNQGLGQKLTLRKVEFNVPIEDSQFKMPVAPLPAAHRQTALRRQSKVER